MSALAAVAAAAACAMGGSLAAGRLTQREALLQGWDEALLRMESAVVHTGADVPGVLRRGLGPGEPALKELLSRLAASPAAPPEALLKGLPWHPLLLPEEKDILLNALAGLFSSSLEGQAQALAYARAQWAVCRQAGRADREKNAGLYTALGWLGGAAAFILLC